MNLEPIQRRILRPERVPSFLWQVALTVGFYALLFYGVKLADHGVPYPTARVMGPIIGLSVAAVMIVGAFLVKRWQRKPPGRTTAEIEESPAELSTWASSVLDSKHGRR